MFRLDMRFFLTCSLFLLYFLFSSPASLSTLMRVQFSVVQYARSASRGNAVTANPATKL